MEVTAKDFSKQLPSYPLKKEKVNYQKIETKLDIHLTIKANGTDGADGLNGLCGFHGHVGHKGLTGASHSLLSNDYTDVDGKKGGKGQSGSNGENGTKGGNGQDSKTLYLHIEGSPENLFLSKSVEGKFSLESNSVIFVNGKGGKGGIGGRGGDGGRGGNGGK
jgi:hypothetical protein